MNKKQQQALLTLNAHHLRRRLDSLPKVLGVDELRNLNEDLVIWLVGWLDELSNDLEGQPVASTSHLRAVDRCLHVIHSTTGLVFPEPLILTNEGLAMNSIVKPATTAAVKPAAPVTAAAVPAAKPAVKAAKPAVKAAKPAVKPAVKAEKLAVKPAVKTAKPAVKAAKPIGKDLGRAPARKKKEASATQGRAGDGDYLLKVMVEANPKREGTMAHKQFALYAKSKTIHDFIAKGGTRLGLRYDIRQGYVKAIAP